jgi:hypothetical protein
MNRIETCKRRNEQKKGRRACRKRDVYFFSSKRGINLKEGHEKGTMAPTKKKQENLLFLKK